MTLLEGDAPNGYTVLSDLIKMAGPIVATIVTYWLARKRAGRIEKTSATAATAATSANNRTIEGNAKVDQVAVVVNGANTALRAEVATLKAQLAGLHAAVGHRRRGDRPIAEHPQDAPDPASPAGDET